MQDENEDLDALLEQFALDDAAKSTVQVIEDCSPPSARVFASFTPSTLRVSLQRPEPAFCCALSAAAVSSPQTHLRQECLVIQACCV